MSGYMTRAKKRKIEESLYLDDPIDVVKHLQTTFLCMNRILKELGISRIIVVYHKDLLAEKVKLRMRKLVSVAKVPGNETLFPAQEYAAYMRYFLNDSEFTENAVKFLTVLAYSVINEATLQAIFQDVLPAVMAAYARYADRLVEPVVCLMAACLCCRRGGTRVPTSTHSANALLDMVLDCGAINVILDAGAVDDELALLLTRHVLHNLTARPLGRHFGLVDCLEAALNGLPVA
jgi:AcrR family transcriptional regulator